ncbi:uncharacterized protein LOC106660927 [Cimex lectularius]|uniref:Uncharacterized protein n=1 Tax=Cimex lectularius TaxID=79782 RepID=A0A8I6R617_CIMLE|nr:uncharacterized protein LOC106660927 [Cimex lectularius]
MIKTNSVRSGRKLRVDLRRSEFLEKIAVSSRRLGWQFYNGMSCAYIEKCGTILRNTSSEKPVIEVVVKYKGVTWWGNDALEQQHNSVLNSIKNPSIMARKAPERYNPQLKVGEVMSTT